MNTNEDIQKYSDDTLVDILTHIKREKYPQRYQMIRNEFVRRHGPTVDGVSIDDYFDRARLIRPFAERWTFKKKLLLVLLGWTALMLVVQGIIHIISIVKQP